MGKMELKEDTAAVRGTTGWMGCHVFMVSCRVTPWSHPQMWEQSREYREAQPAVPVKARAIQIPQNIFCPYQPQAATPRHLAQTVPLQNVVIFRAEMQLKCTILTIGCFNLGKNFGIFISF